MCEHELLAVLYAAAYWKFWAAVLAVLVFEIATRLR